MLFFSSGVTSASFIESGRVQLDREALTILVMIGSSS